MISLCISAVVLAHAVAGFSPSVKGTPEILGLAQDPSINRDSCGSTRFGNRAFWTCRDSQPFDTNGTPTLPIYSSSASWTDFGSDGTPELVEIDSAHGVGLLMYGENNEQPFYPMASDECSSNTAGGCDDGSRYAIWPDSPPLITTTNSDGSIVAYTWIRQEHILGLTLINDESATTLYRVDYDGSSSSALPTVTLVKENFFTADQFPYGHYGGVVANGYAYIYGQNSDYVVAVARVPVGQVEDASAYEFYQNSQWVSTHPAVDADGISISASAGGQGTYYYSEAWERYVWIGQPALNVAAQFYITTSAAPEGPWDSSVQFYTGVDGNYTLGAYSLQAHPGLLANSSQNAIYLSYTKNDLDAANVNVYTTPLIYLEWE